MIKDLFHSPPIYKANIHLSWKEGDAKSAQKRRLISAPAAADRPGIVFFNASYYRQFSTDSKIISHKINSQIKLMCFFYFSINGNWSII